jgi:hypothetical protein
MNVSVVNGNPRSRIAPASSNILSRSLESGIREPASGCKQYPNVGARGTDWYEVIHFLRGAMSPTLEMERAAFCSLEKYTLFSAPPLHNNHACVVNIQGSLAKLESKTRRDLLSSHQAIIATPKRAEMNTAWKV